ncbi:ATP-NAD kinase [Myriangium duriaei CBS 260.36]|uniref:ATP-NAD kinase n=1 Tax=Myriangium duriaei CBS 260.36 TaxID=1168546 RepID=A0A9P4IV83_9PEZI|nr:ATP-NAD kinase [Myriangium duriaei CBS 260.36]
MRRLSPFTRRLWTRSFSSTRHLQEIRDLSQLERRILPSFYETAQNDLLALQWPAPPRNVLIARKDGSKKVDAAVVEFCNHVQSEYPTINLIVEPRVAAGLHESVDKPIYSFQKSGEAAFTALREKVDLITTLGGDGTILHASSLFATAERVPPVLSFSMGTLGFLGEWKFQEYKRAFREVYMSGADASVAARLHENNGEKAAAGGAIEAGAKTLSGWSSVRGKSMGRSRGSRVLLRNRLKVGVYAPDGTQVENDDTTPEPQAYGDVYAMNEVLLHRGRQPHLSQIQIYVGGRFLTEAVADGMLISTPTGSTAYSLSSGGSIVHPLVSSLLLTPICPRSLSFRPLVLPANTPIVLRLSEKNRAEEVEVSIDGVRRDQGLARGMEVRVVGEDIKTADGQWRGGIPSIVRASGNGAYEGEDHWVGGLNGLLKFNHPFGEDS